MNDNIQTNTTGRLTPCLQKKIDKTAYLVEVHFSDTSTQSVEDKLKRVILQDLEHGKQGRPRKSDEKWWIRPLQNVTGQTAKSILISCGARLAPFDIKELRELMETDEMQLDTIGDRKTALFVIISDTDDTFNFVVSILYTQLFNLLCDKADDEYGGRFPVHVRCLLDEFADIGQIPKFVTITP